jgi:hypothetical protein
VMPRHRVRPTTFDRRRIIFRAAAHLWVSSLAPGGAGSGYGGLPGRTSFGEHRLLPGYGLQPGTTQQVGPHAASRRDSGSRDRVSSPAATAATAGTTTAMRTRFVQGATNLSSVSA